MYPRGPVPAQILFNISINNPDNETDCTLSNIADDTKLGGVADMPESCAAIQSDLDRLEKWTDRNLKHRKCNVLHLGTDISMI